MINHIFYLASIEKLEIVTIQKYKKFLLPLPTGAWNSDFDNSGPWKINLIHGDSEKVIWAAGGRRKVNRAGVRDRGRGAVGRQKIITL